MASYVECFFQISFWHAESMVLSSDLSPDLVKNFVRRLLQPLQHCTPSCNVHTSAVLCMQFSVHGRCNLEVVANLSIGVKRESGIKLLTLAARWAPHSSPGPEP